MIVILYATSANTIASTATSAAATSAKDSVTYVKNHETPGRGVTTFIALVLKMSNGGPASAGPHLSQKTISWPRIY